ncbi:MAG: hypothetical protein R3F49_09045 [Planctomycetota bacterium]
MKYTLLSHALIAAAATASAASAQSTLFGLDFRLDRFFTTDTQDFVGNFTTVGSNNLSLFALDFDASATTMWAVEGPVAPALPAYGTIDITTGLFTPLGVLTGPLSASGITADPDGVTWWLTENDATAGMILWRGDITTGVFTMVGSDVTAGLVIDVAMDSQGNLFVHSITTDSLYSVDKTTGIQTLIGATGVAANFAQGMDFDWSDDTLYATIYTGGGVGQFASIDTATGMATLIADTTTLNAEMEVAVQVPIGSGGPGSNYCTAVANSTGAAASISAAGSNVAASNSLTLTADALPNGAFGFFLTSTTQGFVANPGGSTGNLCLSGSIGRYVGPGQIQNSGMIGSFSLALNLTQTPQPSGTVAITAGQTWNFQAWYRDSVGGSATSNFTNGLSVAFQ